MSQPYSKNCLCRLEELHFFFMLVNRVQVDNNKNPILFTFYSWKFHRHTYRHTHVCTCTDRHSKCVCVCACTFVLEVMRKTLNEVL